LSQQGCETGYEGQSSNDLRKQYCTIATEEPTFVLSFYSISKIGGMDEN